MQLAQKQTEIFTRIFRKITQVRFNFLAVVICLLYEFQKAALANLLKELGDLGRNDTMELIQKAH